MCRVCKNGLLKSYLASGRGCAKHSLPSFMAHANQRAVFTRLLVPIPTAGFRAQGPGMTSSIPRGRKMSPQTCIHFPPSLDPHKGFHSLVARIRGKQHLPKTQDGTSCYFILGERIFHVWMSFLHFQTFLCKIRSQELEQGADWVGYLIVVAIVCGSFTVPDL